VALCLGQQLTTLMTLIQDQCLPVICFCWTSGCSWLRSMVDVQLAELLEQLVSRVGSLCRAVCQCVASQLSQTGL
jgi:hypothetical protein